MPIIDVAKVSEVHCATVPPLIRPPLRKVKRDYCT